MTVIVIDHTLEADPLTTRPMAQAMGVETMDDNQ